MDVFSNNMPGFAPALDAPRPLSIQNRQRLTLDDMLSSSNAGQDDGDQIAVASSEDSWKILIYDSSGREIIAPLLRVADLRSKGVTLHLNLASVRQPVPDVPAVYFIAPTEENIRRVCADCSAALYDSMSINFTSRLPRELLEKLAEGIARGPVGSGGRISRVFDMYTDFLSLESNLFSLNTPGAYTVLNSSKATNSEIEQQVERIVDSLFCVVVTLGAVPIIRAQRSGPAEMVARNLEQRLREHLVSRNNVFSESSGSFQNSSTRPLLVIVDRSIDLPVMLHHTWTYQALTHDTLGLKLNRVTVPIKEDESAISTPFAQSPKPRICDLDKSDAFWAANAGLPFPMVAEAVEGALQAYKDEVAKVNSSAVSVGQNGFDPDADESSGTAKRLAAAVSNLPELTKRKKIIDLHTNIATALLDQIKDRGLDGYFQLEEELLQRPSTFDVERIIAIIRDSKGIPTDKMRIFLIYFLCIDKPPSGDLSKCVTALETAGCKDFRAYTFLKSIKSFTQSISSIPSGSSGTNSSIGGVYAASVLGTLSQVADNVNKLIISADKALASARVMQTLMDQKGDTEVLEGYLALDPKGPKPGEISAVGKRPFRDAVLFVVGPGNYVEYQNCQDHVCSVVKQEGGTKRHVSNGKTLIYGATELCTGSEFLEQLNSLGGPQPQAENGTASKS